MMPRAAETGLLIGLLLTAGAPRAAAQASPTAAQQFLREAQSASRRLDSREAAIRAGYRRLGPDFPGMGEHWVHPQLIVRGVLDAAAPPVLSFVDVDGGPVLVGVAYALALGPDDAPPVEPFGREAWHDHSGAVDEETLLLNHPASVHGHGGGYRLSMVHVWTKLENPDGVLAQNNWALPFFRVGLRPPGASAPEAARGLSLAYGGRRFYAGLLSRAAELSPEERSGVEQALDAAATRAEALISERRGGSGSGDQGPETFAQIWTDFWAQVRLCVRDGTWSALSRLSADPTRRPTPPAGSRWD